MFPLLVLALLLLVRPVSAQTVYKCRVDGKLAYGDVPCAAGSAEALRVPTAPPPDPDTEARLARQKALLTVLQNERRVNEVREARAARAQERAGRAAAQRYQQCARERLHQKWAEEDAAQASGNRRETLRTRARRQRETMALACPG